MENEQRVTVGVGHGHTAEERLGEREGRSELIDTRNKKQRKTEPTACSLSPRQRKSSEGGRSCQWRGRGEARQLYQVRGSERRCVLSKMRMRTQHSSSRGGRENESLVILSIVGALELSSDSRLLSQYPVISLSPEAM
jgi:hypothetical protein